MEGQRRQRQAALEAQRAARERAELAQCTFAPAVLPAAPAALQVRRRCCLKREGHAFPDRRFQCLRIIGISGGRSQLPNTQPNCHSCSLLSLNHVNHLKCH